LGGKATITFPVYRPAASTGNEEVKKLAGYQEMEEVFNFSQNNMNIRGKLRDGTHYTLGICPIMTSLTLIKDMGNYNDVKHRTVEPIKSHDIETMRKVNSALFELRAHAMPLDSEGFKRAIESLLKMVVETLSRWEGEGRYDFNGLGGPMLNTRMGEIQQSICGEAVILRYPTERETAKLRRR